MFSMGSLQKNFGATKETTETKSSPSSKEKYILITDIDNCAIHPDSEHEHYLSTPLLEHVKNGAPIEPKKESTRFSSYTESYICTHRCLSTFPDIMNEERLTSYGHSKHFDARNLLLTHIQKNISTATGLSILAISTPDDQDLYAPKDPRKRCGSGYKIFVQPVEQELCTKIKTHPQIVSIAYQAEYLFKQKETKLTQSKTYYYDHLPFNFRNPNESFKGDKNPQLIDITRHAAATFPEKKCTLDFLDDVSKICKNALSIDVSQIPDNITLRIFQHDAYAKQPPRYIGSVTGTLPLKQFLASLQQTDKTEKSASSVATTAETTSSTAVITQSISTTLSTESILLSSDASNDDIDFERLSSKEVESSDNPSSDELYPQNEGISLLLAAAKSLFP